MQKATRPNVAVLGGGFGGLEAAFYLRMKLGDGANITLVSDRDHFLFGWGNPFHAGMPWKGMEAGLKAMSGLMAR